MQLLRGSTNEDRLGAVNPTMRKGGTLDRPSSVGVTEKGGTKYPGPAFENICLLK